MVPMVYGENLFDDLFDDSLFSSHNPLFGKHARNLMKTDIRETPRAMRFLSSYPASRKMKSASKLRMAI